MSSRLPVLALALPLCLLACARSAPLTPEGSTLSPDLAAPEYALHAGDESLVAMFDVTIDPATLEATVAPIRAAASQPPQALSFDLDIENFLEGDTFRINSIGTDANGDLAIDYSHAHPFNAPVFTNPPTAQNRADLSYTGRLLILAQGQEAIFFSGSVVADGGLVVDPDGFLNPTNLLATPPGGSANTFPYKLLVDEALDNRVGISNSGDPEGNYAPVLGGWQRANAGAGNNGWTGYDYLHGGQEVAGTFHLAGERVQGTLSFRIAVLIKYTDPRGTGNKNFRMPFEPVDPLQFAYRLPFAALDAGKVEALNTIDFGDFVGSARTLHVGVRDWDVNAIEAADPDLSDETDPSLVPPGTSGTPIVTVDMPSVAPAPFAASGSVGTGLPGDELDFVVNVTNSLDPGPGEYLACARVVDPENLVDRSGYHFGVDPETLAPTRTRLELVTFQLIPYTIGGSLPEVESVLPVGNVGLPGASVTFTPNHVGAASFAWTFGRGAFPSTSTDPAPTVVLDEPGAHFGTLVVSNARGGSAPFVFTYIVADPRFPNFPAHAVGAQLPVNPFVLMKNGRPAIVFADTSANPLPISFARATTPAPASGSDWSIHLTDLVASPTSFYGPILTAGVQQDRFVLVGNQGTIAVANVAEPSSAASWTDYPYDALIDGGYGPTLAVLPDRLMIVAYHRGLGDADQQDARISWSNVALPMNAGSWTHSVPINFLNNPSILAPMALIPYSTGVAWAYIWRVDGWDNLEARYSATTTPLLFSDWPNLGLSGRYLTTASQSLDWNVHNDRLHLLVQQQGDLMLHRALVPAPTFASDWHRQSIAILGSPFAVRNHQLRFAADRPVACFSFNSGFFAADPVEAYLVRPLVGDYRSADDWTTRLVHSGAGGFTHPTYGTAAIDILDERVHIAYVAHDNNDELTYAIADGPW